MKALIIGATGATGKDLMDKLLQDQNYTKVVIFVRRPSKMVHPKLLEILTDFDQLGKISGQINGDILFSCLGTTLKAAGSKDRQQHIDYEIPLKFAEVAKSNGVSKIVLLSAYGASAASNIFYSRLKGELEDKIGELTFSQFVIFRPGLLLRKGSDRLGENISAGLLNFLNRLGLVRRFRPLPTSLLAEKLAKSPNVLPNGKYIIELDEIFRF